ncbi:Gfo/Idh/MocA family protein, partial [Persicitalea sp.]|uniref:Gfo/Idh/MocA family protein n=1 Tax=Persicitalea sp. TaxID=3100273 RepID=UPI0035942C4E
MKKQLKGVCVGAGYFAKFHYEAWQRIPSVGITAVADTDIEAAKAVASKFGIPKTYPDFAEMLRAEKPDFVDVITPPATHLIFCKIAADLGVNIIVQKPLAPTLSEAEELVEYCAKMGVRLMVHENFRFQPWHREIKKLLNEQAIGKLSNLNFRMRMGDGWQPDAYLARQPYFRTMPQLLIYETGIHFIDTFRFLAGEVESVFAQLKKLNPDIAGEDAGTVFFNFESGANGIYDANRYNESNFLNARYTFGDFLVEGGGGSIRLYNDGKLTIQKLGETEKTHVYQHENRNFSGDCVFFTQGHFVASLINNLPFETSGEAYLKNIRVQEAIYASSATRT